MNWFAVGGAILWIGVTIQATIEIELIRRTSDKPKRWYSRICGWVCVFFGTSAGYANYVHKPGDGLVSILGWFICTVFVVGCALWFVRKDDVEYPKKPSADSGTMVTSKPKWNKLVDVLLGFLVLKVLLSKRK